MKKFILMAIVAMFTMSASAQLLTSSRVAHSKSHNTWIDLGLGTYTGDIDNHFTIDLGIRWNKMYTEYVGWDILKIAAESDTHVGFEEGLGVKALTGIRGESPVLFANAKVYANFAGGYYYGIDAEDGCFTWELGAGLKLTPRVNVGIAYDAYKIDNASWGYVNLKLGYAL